jgi:hypothetical protein
MNCGCNCRFCTYWWDPPLCIVAERSFRITAERSFKITIGKSCKQTRRGGRDCWS